MANSSLSSGLYASPFAWKNYIQQKNNIMAIFCMCIILKKVDTEKEVNDVPITHRKAAQVFRGSDTAALQERLWVGPHREGFAGRT